MRARPSLCGLLKESNYENLSLFKKNSTRRFFGKPISKRTRFFISRGTHRKAAKSG